MISDDDYKRTQDTIQVVSGILVGMDPDTLRAFIERGEHAQSIGPLMNPSEWRDGTDKLNEVLSHARALQNARSVIGKATERAAA